VNNKVIKKNQLHSVLEQCKPVFVAVFIFSFVVNIFTLLSSMYSLQVLDRVLGSRNLDTLFFLTLIMFCIYISLGLIQIARSFTLIKLGEWLDKKLSPELFAISIQNAAIKQTIGASQNLRDFQTVKGFLTSSGINTVFDAPWTIIFIAVLFYIHPWMGWLSIVGAVIIFSCALINAFAINKNLHLSNDYNIKSMSQSDIATRNAEVIEAMGMMKDVTANWHHANQAALDCQSIASYRNGIISMSSRYMIRNLISMIVTALGAYLCITQPLNFTCGGMILSSIIVGRALAPFDNAIEMWKQMTTSLKAYRRLEVAFNDESQRNASMALPSPDGIVSVENIYFAPVSSSQKNLAPGATPNYTLKGVNFDLQGGDILAIIGPSAAGKSTLAKLIVGVWKANQGVVRLDGADVYSWNRDDFGKHVGYLPQDVELFSGTIKDNIARLRENADSDDIVNAAKLAGAHDMILRLPNGYETDIGISGSNLSGGQRQRVGLARAFFGNPKLVVLDEPNANLDEIGEQALVNALKTAKERKITTIIVSHRPSILSSVNKILIMQEGAVAAFGDREEIMARFAKPTTDIKENK